MSSELVGKSNEHSLKMFRGNIMQTGLSASHLSCKPSFLWAKELGPMVSSPVFENGIIYTSTITGRIFALNTFQKILDLNAKFDYIHLESNQSRHLI
jgi:hypothetical protein